MHKLLWVMWNLCKLCTTDKLLTIVFGHYVKQPSSWIDVSRMLNWLIETFVYPWHRLTTTSHDQLTVVGVWSQLVWNSSSKSVHIEEHCPNVNKNFWFRGVWGSGGRETGSNRLFFFFFFLWSKFRYNRRMWHNNYYIVITRLLD